MSDKAHKVFKGGPVVRRFHAEAGGAVRKSTIVGPKLTASELAGGTKNEGQVPANNIPHETAIPEGP